LEADFVGGGGVLGGGHGGWYEGGRGDSEKRWGDSEKGQSTGVTELRDGAANRGSIRSSKG
jgi:hypothetical protein